MSSYEVYAAESLHHKNEQITHDNINVWDIFFSVSCILEFVVCFAKVKRLKMWMKHSSQVYYADRMFLRKYFLPVDTVWRLLAY